MLRFLGKDPSRPLTVNAPETNRTRLGSWETFTNRRTSIVVEFGCPAVTVPVI